MSKRIKMSIEMDVTVPQALSLQAMFEHWNRLASLGSSRFISYMVDGDGNFKPNVKWQYNEKIPELTDELRKKAIASDYGDLTLAFDFDGIAWALMD